MLAGIFISSLLVALSGAAVPGSLLVVNLRETARSGLKGGLLVVAGHALVEGGLVLLLVLGLANILHDPHLVGVLGLVGGLVLFWLGWLTLGLARREEGLPWSSLAKEAAEGPGPLLAGAVATLANPYWLVWWAGLGSSYLVLASGAGQWGRGAFFLGHIAGDFLWYGVVSLAVVGGRGFLSSRFYRGLLLTCGVFLLLLALYFVISGLSFLGLVALS